MVDFQIPQPTRLRSLVGALLTLFLNAGVGQLLAQTLLPAVGPYRLCMEASSVVGLSELSPAEYAVMSPAVGERIYHAPPVRFLGEPWQMMVGVTKGRIYKIAPYRSV